MTAIEKLILSHVRYRAQFSPANLFLSHAGGEQYYGPNASLVSESMMRKRIDAHLIKTAKKIAALQDK